MQTADEAAAVCRLITDDIVGEVIDCLERGFPDRQRGYWVDALARMSGRPAIGDCPRYGYALFAGKRVVGALLTIFSLREGVGAVRCNLSSWCVDKEYRGYAAMLHMMASKRRDVTYVNISPAPHTRKGIEALGFQRYCNGQAVVAAFLAGWPGGVRVAAFAPESEESRLLSERERELLRDHEAYGCRSLVCVKDGAAYPFVFLDRMIRGFIPCPQLVYCRSMDEFTRFAGPIGRFLLFRAGPLCLVDAARPIAGLVGRYFPDRGPKYFKGPATPELGDLAYTELVMFGV
jgi:hypothetical protein